MNYSLAVTDIPKSRRASCLQAFLKGDLSPNAKKNYVKQGFFKENTVDTVFVFGGTNDFWACAPLGEVKLSDWSEDDLYCVLPAFCYFMHALKAELPNAEICFIINTDMRAEIGDCIEFAGKYFDVKTVRLHDIDKLEGHPTIKGMAEICEQVLAVM